MSEDYIWDDGYEEMDDDEYEEWLLGYDEDLERQNLVFVYGSLMSGMGNHGLMEHEEAKFVEETFTKDNFIMKDLGYFPAASKDKSGVPIKGEVYDVDIEAMISLDQLEGHPNFYERIKVPLENNMEAWMYLVPRDRIMGIKIESGDWRQYAKERGLK